MEETVTTSLLSDESEDDENDEEATLNPNTIVVKGSNNFLPLASCVAALGGILFGYDIGIISGALLQLKGEFNLSCSNQEMVVTSLIIGGLIASIFGGQIVDHFGRRNAIIFNSFFFIGGALLLALSQSFAMLISGRLLLGFAVSLSAIGECIYISEIATPARRGSLVSLNELGITLGILTAYLVNYLLIKLQHGWRIMFGLSAIPALLQGIGMLFLPWSPRWLVLKQREDQALQVIAKLWPNTDCKAVLEKIKVTIKGEKQFKMLDLVRKENNLRHRMLIGCGIVFFQQITGQPTVLYYAPAVFVSFGFNSSTSATLATVGLGIVKVIFTSMALVKVDKLGRRFCLLLGAVTMTLSVIVLSIVTRPIGHLHSQNPCDRNFVGTAHAHVSNRTTLCTNIVLRNTTQSNTNTNALNISTRVPSAFHVSNRGVQSSNKTDALQNCTELKPLHQIVYSTGNVKYICLIALMTFVAGYAIGYGPMSWLLLTEIFPVGIKGRAVAIATVFNWGTNILISLTFLETIASVGPSHTFVIYSVSGALSIVFIYLFVVETKQKSLEQISNELNNRPVFCLPNICRLKLRSQRLQYSVQMDDTERQSETSH